MGISAVSVSCIYIALSYSYVKKVLTADFGKEVTVSKVYDTIVNNFKTKNVLFIYGDHPYCKKCEGDIDEDSRCDIKTCTRYYCEICCVCKGGHSPEYDKETSKFVYKETSKYIPKTPLFIWILLKEIRMDTDYGYKHRKGFDIDLNLLTMAKKKYGGMLEFTSRLELV